MSTSSPFSLHEKVILVTGAGGGLGRQFAMTLASAGASIACLDRDVRGASETVSAIQRSSGVADVYIADVSEENILNDAVQSIIKTFGRIDVLVNNAGISTRPVRIHELPTTDWDRVMSINLRGTYLCAKAVLPYKFAYLAMHFFGAIIAPVVAWDLGDIFLGIVILPNLIALVWLSGKTKKMMDSYFERKPWLENLAIHQRLKDEGKPLH